MYLTPWNLGGINPEKNGTKADANKACIKSSLDSNCVTNTFLPSQTRVKEMCNFPETRRWASSGKNCNTKIIFSNYIFFFSVKLTLSKPAIKASCTLNDGRKGPNTDVRASVAILRTSLVMSPKPKCKC